MATAPTTPGEAAPALYRYRFGSADFDEARFELRVGGLPVDLQQKPLQLLALLLAAPGERVSKQRLLDTLWRDRATGDAVLANAASKLRSALGPDNAPCIVTVPRQGYRFEGPLERVAVGRQSAPVQALQAGMAVPGRAGHRLLRPLGQPPRQDVWLAEQPKTGDRRVFKFALDGQRLADLKREVTVARLLRETLGEREDFVRVLDWRFEEAPYWLECAWAGSDLQAWAEVPLPDGRPQLQALPLDQRLAIGLQVADALAAAHGAGVLHKDLKPANVLIEATRGAEAWQVRLSDFGSARLLDEGRLAQLRLTRMGLTLDATDPRSGGTPYYIAPEVLAGATPGTRTDVYALGVLLFQLLTGQLQRPLAPGWEREIDDELLREDIAAATDIDPARRLASATEVATRLRRLPQRHRERAEERAAAANAERLRAEVARLQLVAQQTEAVQALNRLLREDLVGAANPQVQGRADITVAQALHNAAEGIDTKYAALTPALRGSLHAAMQLALSELSRAEDAVRVGRRAVAALRAVPAADLNTELLDTLRSAQLRLAMDCVQLSRLDEAAALLDDIEAAAPPPAEQAPLFRARLLYVRAWVVSGDLSVQASVAPLREALALVEGMADSEASVRGPIMFSLADSLAMLGQHAEAEGLYRQLHASQVRSFGADDPRPCYTLVGLGNAVARQGRLAEARQLFTQAEAGLRARLGAQHRQTLQARDMLAGIRFKQGDHAGAAAEWADVQAGLTALLGPGSSYVLTVQTQRAQALQGAGTPAAALPLLQDALRAARGFLADDAPQVRQIRHALAVCLLELGRRDEAAPLCLGLTPAALAIAQPEDDWPLRLAELGERLRG